MLTAIDIPAIRVTLRDRITTTSQQAVNRIENQLSDKPRSAGSPKDLIVEDDYYEGDAMYSLGKTFLGEAKCRVRQTWR